MNLVCLAGKSERKEERSGSEGAGDGDERGESGTLHKNVTLVQKSSKTSVEQSFFAGCPSGSEERERERIHPLVLIHAKEWLESESDGSQPSDTLSCVAVFFFHQSPP
jgi:hypothetical protein